MCCCMNYQFVNIKDNEVCKWQRMHIKSITLHCIAFPESKVSENDCRTWNISYKYKNVCTI
jgi:hypothetical protein